MKDNYFVGLDLGSNSIGWAATDEEYNFLRLKGKTAWGSRIFKEANSKKGRRTLRSNRRRLQRKKYRIKLLNDLFAEEIHKIDKTFFLRLENSTLVQEDKNDKCGRNLIFKTKDEEINFYKKYPTIWRLRKSLIDNDEDALSDLRHVYLAIHHIIKYRGNFLTEGESVYKDLDESIIERINYAFSNVEDFSLNIDCDKLDKLKEILLNNELPKNTKKNELKKLFEFDNKNDNKKYVEMFVTIATGGTFALSKIVDNTKTTIDFTNNFEESAAEIEQQLNKLFDIVLCAKEMYDYATLHNLMNGKEYISYVMDDVYEEHKKDLRILKNIFISIDKELKLTGNKRTYYKVFKDTKIADNYASFVHHNSDEKRVNLSDFNSFVEKELNKYKEFIKNEEDYNYLLKKVKDKKLLRIIANESTSVIPHQCHLKELRVIIDNASLKYPFLKDIKEKLIALFKFRVPYYVGPLNSNSPFAWVKRKDYTSITPWNMDNIIDIKGTKKAFIEKLTNNCSYLYSEKVMPRTSLIFEEYLILDRLNVMLVNGSFLKQDEKDDLLNFILKNKKTTIHQLKRYLSLKTATKENDIQIAGIKLDVAFEATSHATLVNCFNLEKEEELVEHLIFLATIYADDKKSLKELLTQEYAFLSENQRKAILNLPTNKWAPLSKKLLCGILYEDNLGCAYSILDVMKQTNKNFQMVLNDEEYGFAKKIKEYNDEFVHENQIESILEQTPTIMARSINQTLLILEDVVRATKNTPKKIFIETTREDDEAIKGKEKDSRYKELEHFLMRDLTYISKDHQKELVKELSDFENDKLKLKSKHLYLYFKQMGLDMYSGEKINIEDVLNSNLYDVDHIIPQSLIKDDSLDNLVLVNRNANQKIKGDTYPIPNEIKTKKVLDLWYYLRQQKAISEKKYNNLMRQSKITLEELETFVARQINVVNYSNIQLRNILAIKYPKAQLIFSKAQYTSYIREKYNIVKNRDLNDAHHAVDAYLNVVAGNILSTQYSNVQKLYLQKEENSKATSFDMEKTISRILKLHDSKGNLYLDKVRNNCFRHDPLITFKVEYQNGELYKTTIFKKSNNDSLIPIHTKGCMADVTKYGGYSSLTQAYLMVVSYIEKNKQYKKILRVPLMLIKKVGNNQEKIAKEIVKNEVKSIDNVKNIKVIKRLYLNQKIKYNKGIYLLYTNNEKQNKYKLVYQSYIDNSILEYLKLANKKIQNFEDSSNVYECFVHKETKVISKNENEKIFDTIIKMYNQSVFDSCNYIVKAREMEKEKFMFLTLKNQIITLNNMIYILSRKSEKVKIGFDFKNESVNNKMLLSNNISNQKIEIIYESASGLYSHKETI